MKYRLNKFIASSADISRRKAEEWIRDGRIYVNGSLCTELGTQVDPDIDEVRLNGKILTIRNQKKYFMIHKPIGYLSSRADPHGEKFVTDLVPCFRKLYPVGRLDKDSSGLLILTDDGDLTYRLTHPKYEVEKGYLVLVSGYLTREEKRCFRNGILLDGRKTAKAKLNSLKRENGKQLFLVTITEGRNRQVRRMFDALGHPVLSLKRVSMGSLQLGSLPEGDYRALTKEEVEGLKKL